MNTQTTFSLSTTYLRHWTLSWLLFLLLSATGLAADLTFTPNAPIVEINKTITLSVAGAIGQVRWQAFDGTIQGEGTQVTYLAPNKVGKDTVTVMDGGGNTGLKQIVITLPNKVSPENAQWKIFTNRRIIQALLLSEDGKTLWVGTGGGLEKRDAQTGETQQFFINTDGLPGNWISALLSDGQGGLWIGTAGGLAHYTTQEQWEVFNTENSGLLNNDVQALLSDGQGGLWVGTDGGLAHYTTQRQWTVFNTENSGLPDNRISALSSDSQSGLWIGTYEQGLAHYTVQGQWRVFNIENSGLPDNTIRALLSDNRGNLWIGTACDYDYDENRCVGRGLVRYTAQGQWTVFNSKNSSLPGDYINILLDDNQGGLWIGTDEGLAHYSVQEQWMVFDRQNSGLPDNGVHALLSDNQGRLWIGTFWEGLALYSKQGQWMILNSENHGLPDNVVHALSNDNQDGLWVGTFFGGLAHFDAQRVWTVFSTENLVLPDNTIKALLNDNQGGLWVGTFRGGLAHYNAQGLWTIFNTDNSGLPGNSVFALLSDDQGGLWIGTDKGLAHYTVQKQWQVFNTENSSLPDNRVYALSNDNQGGLWIGTFQGGVAHYSVQKQWTVFNTDNSKLPGNHVNALLTGNQGDLWIGTFQGGIAHYSVQGEWTVFNAENSGLPDNKVSAITFDNQGGLWVGTKEGGLAHYSNQGQWQVFNTKNSDLPDNYVRTLLNDNQDSLWAGTEEGGLAHLTFTQKTARCQQETTDATTCEKLQTDKRATILIAGGGTHSDNSLWDTTEAITNYLYKVLNQRGFDNDEIYYLSPKSWADINEDDQPDLNIVDAPKPERPLTPEDVRLAVEWANGRGKLDQPLYLFFVDHGGTEKFQLSKLEYLEVTALKTWLDDYQTVTGNQVVMVIDACHSGQLLEQLKAPNRAIISSTSAGLAYFDRLNKQGFSRFFAKGLFDGQSFLEAFNKATKEQTKLLTDPSKKPFVTGTVSSTEEIGQLPKLEDGSNGQWLKGLYLNGPFVAGDLTLAVEGLTTATTVPASQAISLKAKAVLAADKIERVWATLSPPKMNFILDNYGTPILAMPWLELWPSAEKDVWEATWTEAVYNGDYQVTFYAKDNQGNIASSDLPVVITVTGGVEPPPQATVQPELDKAQYHRGETVKATLTEELSWGYDLYAALVLPDGKSFRAIKNTNELGAVDELVTVDNQLNALKNPNPIPWIGLRRQHSPLKVLELPLSDEWALGTYCFYGILSPEGGNVFESMAKGLGMLVGKCFEVVP